jgi:hypothetical protein
MSRGGVQGFQNDRLSQILAARRLTQVQLASMVEVSPDYQQVAGGNPSS